MKTKLTENISLALHDLYKRAYPYPHISIDNFITIEDIRLCAKEIERFDEWGYDPLSSENQVNKYFYPWGDKGDVESTLSTKTPTCWKWLCYFYSKEFLNF